MNSTHHCKAQDEMSENNQRQRLTVECHWYGWAIDIKDNREKIQIDYCPFCGKKLRK